MPVTRGMRLTYRRKWVTTATERANRRPELACYRRSSNLLQAQRIPPGDPGFEAFDDRYQSVPIDSPWVPVSHRCLL
jgi:hypothetical protein